MAMVGGGTSGGKVIFDSVINNDADRLLYVQEKHGKYETWGVGQGVVNRRLNGFEQIEIESDPLGSDDGQTFGDNRLVSVSGFFRVDMVGSVVIIDGMRRTVTIFTNSTEIEVSGDAIPAATGVTYSVEGGTAAGGHELLSGAQVIDGRLVQAAPGRVRMLWRLASI
jgi:hypothetical protein